MRRVRFVAVRTVLHDGLVQSGAILVELRFQLFELVQLFLLVRHDLRRSIRAGGLARRPHNQCAGRKKKACEQKHGKEKPSAKHEILQRAELSYLFGLDCQHYMRNSFKTRSKLLCRLSPYAVFAVTVLIPHARPGAQRISPPVCGGTLD